MEKRVRLVSDGEQANIEFVGALTIIYQKICDGRPVCII